MGSAYFTNIGISSSTKNADIVKSAIDSAEELIVALEPISRADFEWVQYLKKKNILTYYPTFKNFINYLLKFPFVFLKYFGFAFYRRELLFLITSFLRVVYVKFFKKYFVGDVI
jgi:hypothetical protein